MSRSEIKLDQINRRLGSHGTAGGGMSFNQPFSAASADGESESAILSSGFIATICAIFLLVSSGSYFYAGGQITLPGSETQIGDSEFVPLADASCLALWKSEANNAAAMNCYLSTQPGRLCDVRERKYLARLFVRYREDNSAFLAQTAANVKDLRERMVKNGIKSKAGVFDMLNSPSKSSSLKGMGRNMRHVKDSLNLGGSTAGRQAYDDAVARQKKQLASIKAEEAKLSTKITILASAGYVSKGDFGWFPDPIVKKGFSKVEDVPADPCGQ
ncbi:MAG: hypothetical protein U1E15_13755 [Hyphomicrobiales bacterium]